MSFSGKIWYDNKSINLYHFYYREIRGEKQLKIQRKKQKTAPRLRRGELWAIALTLLFLAAAAGYHIGVARRAPEVRVETSRDRFSSVAAPVVTAPPAEEAAAVVDLNTANEEELKELSGIGDVLAARIVAYRAEHGPFQRVEDITLVSGVGASVLEANRDRMTVGEIMLTEGKAA